VRSKPPGGLIIEYLLYLAAQLVIVSIMEGACSGNITHESSHLRWLGVTPGIREL